MAILPFRKKSDKTDCRTHSEGYKKVLEKAVRRNSEFNVKDSVASKKHKKRFEDRIK